MNAKRLFLSRNLILPSIYYPLEKTYGREMWGNNPLQNLDIICTSCGIYLPFSGTLDFRKPKDPKEILV